MRVVELPCDVVLPQDRTRSPGYHLSGIIRGIALQMGWLDAKYDNAEFSNHLLMAIGLAWEDWATKHLHPEVLYHPPELCVDDIYLTLDGVTNWDDLEYSRVFTTPSPTDATYVMVNEFKTTHKSSRGLDTVQGFQNKKWFMWLAQIKGYCYALDTRWAKLHALFLKGDYSKGHGGTLPEYRTFMFEFEPFEIQENWDMMLNNKHLGRPE